MARADSGLWLFRRNPRNSPFTPFGFRISDFELFPTPMLLHILKVPLIFAEVLMVFNLMIIVHELGHFLAAKWRGLVVEKFGIWFGKPLWKKTIGGVEYSFGSIPFGGFVALPQMAPMEVMEGKTETPREALPPVSALDLAREAGERGGTLPAVLNAANEVAVAAFLDSRISFPRIWETVAHVMHRHPTIAEPGLDDILEADREARAAAGSFVSTGK